MDKDRDRIDEEEIKIEIEDYSLDEAEAVKTEDVQNENDAPKEADSQDNIPADDDMDLSVLDDSEVDYNTYYAEEPGEKGKSGKIGLIAAIVAVLAVALVAAGILIYKFTPSKERVDLGEFFGVTGEQAKLVYNFEMTDYSAIVRDGVFYVENRFWADNVTDKFFYDDDNNSVIYTTATQIYTIPAKAAQYDVDGESRSSDYVIALYEDGILYIAVNFAEDKGDFVWKGYENPARIAIVSGGTNCSTAELLEKGAVRKDADIKSPMWERYDDNTGTEWYATGQDKEGWLGVMSMDGRYGYIKNGQYRTGETLVRDFVSGYVKTEYPSQVRDHEILLVWHGIYDLSDNGRIEALLAPTKGVNTVSPTWYKAIDSDGNIESMADMDYVEYIHSQGMEIWPLISDFTSTDSENGWDEKKLLGNTESRRNLIGNLMNEIETYGFDGINIDFEKVPKDAEAEFTQFVRELSIQCRKAEVVLSIDNYVPKPYNAQYNRAAQGECADYVIVMGYDEHYNGSEEAGSVASIGFVTEGMDETLKEVPKEKVINGIPFYTRMFSTSGADGEIPESKAYTMQGAIDAADELGLTVTWDSDAMQNMASGWANGRFYSVWLEDEKSMAVRIRAVKDRHIAGVAAWSLGSELDTIWDVINN